MTGCSQFVAELYWDRIETAVWIARNISNNSQFSIFNEWVLLTKTGAPGFAKIQLRNTSCIRISGNGPPCFVSPMSHFVTLSLKTDKNQWLLARLGLVLQQLEFLDYCFGRKRFFLILSVISS